MTGRARSTCSISSGCARSAAYPDGRKATGAEAYAAYGRESGPVFERLGGKIVWQGRFELMLIGPEDERWDHCFIAEYPSVAAFAEMIRDPGLPRGGETSPGRGRGFAPDPPRRAAGRQDVWRSSAVIVDVEDVHRLPVQLCELLDRLRRLFGRRGAEEQVRAGILDLEDLRIDGRMATRSEASATTIFVAFSPRPALMPFR